LLFFLVKDKFSVALCVYVYVCMLPEKAIFKMIYTVSGETLNPKSLNVRSTDQ